MQVCEIKKMHEKYTSYTFTILFFICNLTLPQDQKIYKIYEIYVEILEKITCNKLKYLKEGCKFNLQLVNNLKMVCNRCNIHFIKVGDYVLYIILLLSVIVLVLVNK